MKKIYLIFGSMFLAGMAFGQSLNKPQATLDKTVDLNRTSQTEVLPTNTDRAIIWENTFSDPNDWTLGNSGPVDISWQIGTGLQTTGDAPISAINSATYDDGVAMIDSDVFANTVAIENSWFETANSLDLSANPYVMIEFANQYFMWDGGASDGNEYCLLEISTDGGTTWPDVETYEVDQADSGTRFELWPNMATQDNVANPTTVRFNISEVAGGEADVKLRWRWVGTWGYAWFVDDIVIYDGYANDIGIEGEAYADNSSYTNLNGTRFVPIEEIDGETFTGFEYFKYPESQRPEIMAITPVINWGAGDLESVVVTGTFDGVSNSSEAQALAAGAALDSVAITQWATADLAAGDYEFMLEATSEVEDEDPSNNSAMASLEMTEFIMARDDNDMTGSLPGTGRQGEAFSGGPLFEVFGEGTVYAIDFAMTDATTPGSEILVELRDATTENFDILSESDEVQIWEGNYNSFSDEEITWVTVVLDNPVDVAAGDLVLPTVTYFGGDPDNGIGVQIGEAQSDAPDQSAFIFGDFGTDGLAWYFSNDVPMVRLNFDENAVTSVEDIEADASNIVLGQNIPNPANGNTVINYELLQSGNVTFEVLDITGKVVYTSNEGNQGAGTYQVELDTELFNAGIYTYTLTVNGEQHTKKMIVE